MEDESTVLEDSSFLADHRFEMALIAASLRSCSVRRFALAIPPNLPRATAAGFFSGCNGRVEAKSLIGAVGLLRFALPVFGNLGIVIEA